MLFILVFSFRSVAEEAVQLQVCVGCLWCEEGACSHVAGRGRVLMGWGGACTESHRICAGVDSQVHAVFFAGHCPSPQEVPSSEVGCASSLRCE